MPRPGRLLLPLVLAVFALGPLSPAPAQASCVGPLLGVGEVDDRSDPSGPDPVALGSGDEVVGVWFREGCDDSGAGMGCAGPFTSAESPLRDVHLVLEQGTRSWDLGTADADSRPERYAISWTVGLPADVEAGAAELTAAGIRIPVLVTATASSGGG